MSIQNQTESFSIEDIGVLVEPLPENNSQSTGNEIGHFVNAQAHTLFVKAVVDMFGSPEAKEAMRNGAIPNGTIG